MPSYTQVISLSGWKGSGKDEIAKYLIERHGFTRLAFADVLKDMTAEAYQVPRSWFDDPELKEKPLLDYPVKTQPGGLSQTIIDSLWAEFRPSIITDVASLVDGIQWVGTSLCYIECDQAHRLYWTPRALCLLVGATARTVDIEYWTKRTLNAMVEGKRYVITDMRFPNEVEAVTTKARSLYVTPHFVRVHREAAAQAAAATTDPSEHALDQYPFKYNLDNNSTIPDLHGRIDRLLQAVAGQ